MAAAGATAAVGKVSPDLRFLFDREGLDLDLQQKIFNAGIFTMRQFGAFFATAEDLRKAAKEDFDLEPVTLAKRVELTKLMVAWESAKTRSARLAEAEAEAEVQQVAKRITGTDIIGIRKLYEEKYWKLSDDQVPARVYLEKISEGVEKGELTAELLSDAVNKLEGETDLTRAVWDPSGTLKAIRTSPTVALPRDPEELRTRTSLVGRAWAFVALMQPNAAVLQGATPQTWQSYLDYLLGPNVHRLHSRDEYGNITHSPSWNLLLSYELEIRRKMVSIMTEYSTPLHQALQKAMNDPVVKERYFTTPLALHGVKRKASDSDLPFTPGRKGTPKGKGKGKGQPKGKGKGKFKGSTVTPDNQPICFAFNIKRWGCRGKCRFKHVCSLCFKDHPAYNCKP